MLNREKIFSVLESCGITFFTGVPDSYLNGFNNYLTANFPERNIIAANEGNAVGIACGHYIATGEIPLVYMQNSGIGNAMNPLVSLADKDVYSIPMLLLIGWRGQGNTEPNHPQHKLQGEITTLLPEIMNIPYTVLTDSDENFEKSVETAVEYCRKTRRSYALIAPKGVMADVKKEETADECYPMSREDAIEAALDSLPADSIFAATTGRATRELYFLRERRNESHDCDFLNVGSMGHCSSVALGIALTQSGRQVVALDGDSAAIMHMGALTMMSKLHVPNFLHIVLNNGAHESVGGQPSAGYLVDFTKIAESCGYATVGKAVTTKEELIEAIKILIAKKQAGFIDCRIHKGLKNKLPPIVFDHRQAIDGLIGNLNKKS